MKQFIHGQHSIEAALLNPLRLEKELYTTEDAFKIVKNKLPKTYNWNDVKVFYHSLDLVQSKAQKYFVQNDYRQQRISSNMFLMCERLKKNDTSDLIKHLDEFSLKKFIVLDSITDVQNAAAILRTCAFYAVDGLIVSTKQEMEMNPSFVKIASGAVEFVPLYYVSNLVKVVDLLNDRGVLCLALTEHTEEQSSFAILKDAPLAIFLGAEDKGLSHAVLRKIKTKMRLNPLGKISSLNVHAAATVVMDRYFSKSVELS